MEYLDCRAYGKKWGLHKDVISRHCRLGHLKGAIRLINGEWRIPADLIPSMDEPIKQAVDKVIKENIETQPVTLPLIPEVAINKSNGEQPRNDFASWIEDQNN